VFVRCRGQCDQGGRCARRQASRLARLGWTELLAARGIRVQVDAGLVDLAAQFAPLVRGEAAGTALRALFLLLLLLLDLAALLLGAGVARAHIELARVALLDLRLLWRRWRHAFGTRLFAVGRMLLLRLLRLLLTIALAIPVTILAGKRRHAGARHGATKHDRADERMRAATTANCCMDVGERDIHGVPLPRCRINR
jgi:hypothetical protein